MPLWGVLWEAVGLVGPLAGLVGLVGVGLAVEPQDVRLWASLLRMLEVMSSHALVPCLLLLVPVGLAGGVQVPQQLQLMDAPMGGA